MTKDDQTLPDVFIVTKFPGLCYPHPSPSFPPLLTLSGGDDPISAHTAHDVSELSLMSWAQLLARRNWG